jgi:NADH-quinone oxidoreductase subunit J
MTLYAGIFYLLAMVILVATAMAITRRHVVHAVCFLIISFFGTALIFYLLGAPLLAALEVIIYAGAIMVLFLFIIMMLRVEASPRTFRFHLRQCATAIFLGFISFSVGAILIVADPSSNLKLKAAVAGPTEFGQFLFQHYWYPVEIASFLLLIALVGALYLGRRDSPRDGDHVKDMP